MAWVWSWLDALLSGPAGMLLVHNLVFWSGLALVASVVRRRSFRCALFVLSIGYMAPIFGMLGTIWKDVGMASALLLTFACIFAGDRWARRWLLVVALPLFFYAGAVRHNGLIAVLPLALYWGVVVAGPGSHGFASARLWLRGAVVGSVLFSVLVVGIQLTNGRLTEGRRSHGEQQVLLHDLVRISVATGDMLVPPGDSTWPSNLEEITRLDASNVGPLYWGSGEVKRYRFTGDAAWISKLWASWLEHIPRNLGTYLWHRWTTFRALLGLEKRVCHPFHEGIDPNSHGIVHHPSMLNRGAMKGLNSAAKTPLYRGWVYALLLTGLVGWELASRERRRAELLGLEASGLGYLALYFFVAPVCDFRLLLWPVIAAFVAVGIAFSERGAR
jgi:hypothetical protein